MKRCPRCGGTYAGERGQSGEGYCGACRRIYSLATRRAIEQWNPVWVKTHKEIAAWLERERGIKVSSKTVEYHRERMLAEKWGRKNG